MRNSLLTTSCRGNASVLSSRVGSDRRSQPGRVHFAPGAALARRQAV